MKQKCEECGSPHVVKSGKTVRRSGILQKYQCQACGKIWVTGENYVPRGPINNPECPRCGESTVKAGVVDKASGIQVQRYRCKVCKFTHRVEIPAE